ncbi:hypothetical protein ACFQY4_39945 [Catellatospora bangladeshensis]|uniref:Uncharacterized protein n=1 Tax=Catellatospora bangladeshensis TaxID=310355 RepID=A0A8J3NK98_9ACTN|nr:hypothetical protein [Catellatospora bangladeshensis]GIF83862.1 hypothetical protein Cba03nite_52110 [Catellatospora bangladeshensis]
MSLPGQPSPPNPAIHEPGVTSENTNTPASNDSPLFLPGKPQEWAPLVKALAIVITASGGCISTILFAFGDLFSRTGP